MNELSTKEKVLAFLKSREGTAVSGKELAEYAGVSGNAVWKAVNTLREAGYNINAKRNSGDVYKRQQHNNIIIVNTEFCKRYFEYERKNC